MNRKFQVSVAGASGYTGMEAVRILHGHPDATIERLYGGKSAGSTFRDLYRGMDTLVDLTILPLAELASDSSDAIFLGLPHGKSAEAVKTLVDAGYKGRIIDMGSDFRLKEPSGYQEWYGREHPYPGLIDSFVYGLTEWYRKEIRLADHISNPGCFATALQLGLIPFVRESLVSSCDVTGITGSSGSGASPSSGTHFSNRFGNVRAYKVYQHQHIGEVRQSLADFLPESSGMPEIRFVPVSGPFVRGIWMTLSFQLLQEADAGEILQEAYYQAPLLRLQDELPELKQVVGSAFTDIGYVQQGRDVVVGVAIDNLLKGAASQAVQNFNLMMDLPEEKGLLFPPAIL